jgi:hypothetical protein
VEDFRVGAPEVSKTARLTNCSFEARIAATQAERGVPSMTDNSPTRAPGPRIARMRSRP